MPDPVDIRPLGPDDVALLEALCTLFGTAFEEPQTYCGARPDARYLERLLGGEHFVAVVALAGDEVVGGLAGYELQKFEQERSEIFIYDLAVAQSHRRRGVATALLERSRTIAAERGAYVVFVQADADDRPATSLYGKFGEPEEALHFDIEVVGSGRRGPS